MPSEAKLFGDNTQYCLESLSSEILAGATQRADSLRIFSNGSYSDWDINSSGLKDACLSWRNTFDTVELVLPHLDVSSLSDMHKEDLMALTNLGIRLSITPEPIKASLDKGNILAQVLSNEDVISFASNTLTANIPNSDWWDLDGYYLVRSYEFKTIQTLDFKLELLKTHKNHDDVEVEITTECDGKLGSFGEKLWSELFKHSESLNNSINGSNVLKSISYSDSYINTPWSLMLFAEIMDSLKGLMSERWDKPDIKLTTGDKESYRSAKGLYAEWSSNDKSDVITEYFNQMDENINVQIKPIRDISHGRILSLYWDDDSVSHIRFDHGVGCWNINKKPRKWLDLESEPKTQVQEMFEMIKEITVKFSKNFPTQIFVKKR